MISLYDITIHLARAFFDAVSALSAPLAVIAIVVVARTCRPETER